MDTEELVETVRIPHIHIWVSEDLLSFDPPTIRFTCSCGESNVAALC